MKKGLTPTSDKPKVTVSKSGALQVTPTEIVRSRIGQDIIRRTAALKVVRRNPPQTGNASK